jgi:iron complex transport system ATP-binding protein
MPDRMAEHIILFEDFSIGYHKESTLLGQLNLTVNRGEMIALIGKNGAGKSTLLKSMIGLVPPLGGACLLDGVPFDAYSLRERARRVSFVSSQFTQLPSLTVEELVGLGRIPYTDWMGRLSAEDHRKIDKAIEEVQMGIYAGRKLENLSDGERQRAMIARAFVQDTPLMVLDEPTAFLDVPNTFELVRLLSRFKESGRSIVYSTHDLETAIQFADKMWVIHKGRILEGAPEDLGLSGLYNELFSDSGITYDEQVGRFLGSVRERGFIAVTGEGEDLLIWTRKTAERLGYRVKEGADLKITVASSPAGASWMVQNRNGSTRFKNLYTLARFLIQE